MKVKIHREGKNIIINAFITIIALILLFIIFVPIYLSIFLIFIFSIIFFLVVWFFRFPFRSFIKNNKYIYAPADGKIVAIEPVFENEYFKDQRLQVSIFMSPLNVHVNFYPVSGKVKYVKYHPGNYLVAWHPKSSELNERSTVVIETNDGKEIMVRQIAGIMARRIVTYALEGQYVEQGEELGFIKFGSRVDIILPLDTKIKVNLGTKSRAMITIIGELN